MIRVSQNLTLTINTDKFKKYTLTLSVNGRFNAVLHIVRHF